jgi:AcrR family transcriptional regulator
MARKKSADKRVLIQSEAKRLFASRGFSDTSMGGLADAIGIPVGSLYTYFLSKEALLESIIEEGWKEFVEQLEMGIADPPFMAKEEGVSSDINLARLSFLVRVAFPKLFEDLDLIAILLAQAGKSSKLEAKLEYLAGIISSIVTAYKEKHGANSVSSAARDGRLLKTGLAVMLLGSLESMRLIHHASIDIAAEDVIAFLVSTIEAVLGCSLPA